MKKIEPVEKAIVERSKSDPECPTCNDIGIIGGPSYAMPDEGGEPCPDCNSVERSIDKILGEVSERRLADGSEPVTVKFAEEADVAATADRMIAKYAKTLDNLSNR